MDLYDILIAMKLAGGGGGGGGNVETATIVITVTNGTATITSGAFPDWCTEANSDNIMGRAMSPDYDGENYLRSGFVSAANMGPEHGDMLKFYGGFAEDQGTEIMILPASLFIMVGENQMQSGTLTITLIYMPN